MKLIHSLHDKKKKNKTKLYKLFIFVIIILFFVFTIACCITFYLYADFIKQSSVSNIKDIKLDNEKNITLYKSNNDVEEVKIEKVVIEKIKVNEYKDSESRLLNIIQRNFVKPFNYQEGSFCSIKINILTKEYKINQCNSDAIFKRNVELSLIKSLKTYQMPVKGKNNVDENLDFTFQLAN